MEKYCGIPREYFGEYLGNTWRDTAEYLGNIQDFEEYLGNTWEILGEYLGNSWGNIQEILVLEKFFDSDNFACLGTKVSIWFQLVRTCTWKFSGNSKPNR